MFFFIYFFYHGQLSSNISVVGTNTSKIYQ